jgi:putative phosphoribosyl transferase
MRDRALMIFADRFAGGVRLGEALRKLQLPLPLAVLGLPRGGVLVAFEVARVLQAPLDVLVVRKVASPADPEFALGAIAPGNVVVHEAAPGGWGETDARSFEKLAQAERAELERREGLYRAGLAPLDLRGVTAILVDDGLATGYTMLAAVRSARQLGASSVIAAAPVGSSEAAALIAGEADHVALLQVPPYLRSVGEWYEDFAQIEDAAVCELLQRSRAGAAGTPPTHPGAEGRAPLQERP